MSASPGRPRRLLPTLITTVLAAALLVAAAPAADSATPTLKLVWSDEFTGAAGAAPNPNIWGYQTGGGGWGNGELECYTSARSNSLLGGDGSLWLVARRQSSSSCPYTSARLTSRGLRSSQYGRIEARAELPTGAGIWPAVWLLGSGNVGWPAEGEIDVVEVFGKSPTTIHGTVHGPKSNGAPYQVTGQMTAARTTDSGYHVYGINWSPSGIAFTYDNYTYFTATKAAVQAQGRWVFDHPFYALLNVAVGGTYGGAPTSATAFPKVMHVDYVRAYEPA